MDLPHCEISDASADDNFAQALLQPSRAPNPMKSINLRILIPLLVIGLASRPAPAADPAADPDPPPAQRSWTVKIDWSPAEGDPEGALWQGYLMARFHFIVENS